MTSLGLKFPFPDDSQALPEEFISQAFQVSRERFGNVLRTYYPSNKFPSLSVTGAACSLSCKHCGKTFLRNMIPVTSPKVLVQKCIELRKKGAFGVLISGGLNEEGVVPLEDFYPAMREVKTKTGMVVVAHPGLVSKIQAKELADSGVDVVSADVIGDDRTVQEIIGLDRKASDYFRALRNLAAAKLEVVPHVGVGFYYGETLGVESALKASFEINPRLIVFLGLLPARGSPMEGVSPPEPQIFQRIIVWSRLTRPDIELSMGCMRERNGILDELAILGGINRIEIPRKQAIEAAVKLGLEVREIQACCALPKELESTYDLTLSDPSLGRVSQ